MRVQHLENAETRRNSRHRPDGIELTSLLQGDEGTAGNFDLMLIRAAKYHAPRHRHNFDQIRVMLQGQFGYDSGVVQTAGTIGYFPEGVAYTQRGDEPSLTLLLQSGGASGSGYMSYRQLQSGIAELAQHGEFHDGIYTWVDKTGRKHNKDGYEAAWEQINGKKISYPQPRYLAPVLLVEERFDWQAVESRLEVTCRRFGSFTERGLMVERYRLATGARWTVNPSSRIQLLYVVEGDAVVEDSPLILSKSSAVSLDPGESLAMRAGRSCELYRFTLMCLS